MNDTDKLHELTRWLFDALRDGIDIDGGDAQDKLVALGLIERRPVDPDTNESGAEYLYFMVEP